MSSFSIALDRTVPDYRIRPDGRLALSRNADTVRDRLFLAYSLQTGDWYLDNRMGLPWYPVNNSDAASILGGTMSDGEVQARLRRRALVDPEVASVQSLEMARTSARHVRTTISVTLDTGESIQVEV